MQLLVHWRSKYLFGGNYSFSTASPGFRINFNFITFGGFQRSRFPYLNKVQCGRRLVGRRRKATQRRPGCRRSRPKLAPEKGFVRGSGELHLSGPRVSLRADVFSTARFGCKRRLDAEEGTFSTEDLVAEERRR